MHLGGLLRWPGADLKRITARLAVLLAVMFWACVRAMHLGGLLRGTVKDMSWHVQSHAVLGTSLVLVLRCSPNVRAKALGGWCCVGMGLLRCFLWQLLIFDFSMPLFPMVRHAFSLFPSLPPYCSRDALVKTQEGLKGELDEMVRSLR